MKGKSFTEKKDQVEKKEPGKEISGREKSERKGKLTREEGNGSKKGPEVRKEGKEQR